MVFVYYDNPRMLQQQIVCWNAYAGVVKPVPKVILVDDASPRHPAAEVLLRYPCKIPVEVYRIKEDIPWNCSGARNLGCLHAEGWIYMSDMDTILLSDDARRMFSVRRLKRGTFYLMRRCRQSDLQEIELSVVNLLFHKSKYLEIGGYDEDYAGFYAHEERDFILRLERVATAVLLKQIAVRLISGGIVPDANTQALSRDRQRNRLLFYLKGKAGFGEPAPGLRFSWERVL
jgi:hypothetical protein